MNAAIERAFVEAIREVNDLSTGEWNDLSWKERHTLAIETSAQFTRVQVQWADNWLEGTADD